MMRIVEFAEAPRPMASVAVIQPRQSGFEVFEDLATVEGLWRRFEQDGVCTPYQRFDWVRSFAQAMAADQNLAIRVLLLRDQDGRPLLLVPLGLRRQHGMTTASFLGGVQANFNLPITAAGLGAAVPAPDLNRLLLSLGRERLGVDAFVFLNQPLSWRGEPNPLAALGGTPSVNKGYKLTLTRNVDESLARGFSSETRKKMRKKRRLLTELGEVSFWRARDAAEVEAVLAAFLQQKQARFQTLGIDNPFKAPAMQSFLRQGSLAGLDRGRPAIELYGLSVGGRVIATFGGAADGWRLCGMFNSFDSSPDVTRCSPGELLLADIIQRQCEMGRQVFDLGVGEAYYKSSICDAVEPLIDVLVPVTAKGRLYIAVKGQASAAKRSLKQVPWARRMIASIRAARAKLAPAPASGQVPRETPPLDD